MKTPTAILTAILCSAGVVTATEGMSADRIRVAADDQQLMGDCKVHMDLRYPVEPGKAGQGRGNSGFSLPGKSN